MRKNMLTVGLVGAVLALGVATIALAQTTASTDGIGMLQEFPIAQHVVKEIAAKLNLTDTQKQQIHGIVAAERPVMAPLATKLKHNADAIRQLSEQGAPDSAKLDAAAARCARSLTDVIVESERVKTQVVAILTPDQQAQAKNIRAKIEARFRDRLENVSGAPERLVGILAWNLNLTDDQKTRISTILASEKPAVQPLVAQLVDNWHGMNALTDGGRFDEAAVRAQVQKSEPVVTTLIADLVQTKLQVAAVLTPEQRAQAKEFRKGLHSRLAQRWIQHHGGQSMLFGSPE